MTLLFEQLLNGFQGVLGSFQFQLISVRKSGCDGLVIRIATNANENLRRQTAIEIIEAFGRSQPIHAQFVGAGKIHELEIEWRDYGRLETTARTGKMRRVIDLRAL